VEREKEKVFVMIVQKMIGPLTIDCDWTFIGDDCDIWTNEKMTRGMTNFLDK
jgi:hypothetical protein